MGSFGGKFSDQTTAINFLTLRGVESYDGRTLRVVFQTQELQNPVIGKTEIHYAKNYDRDVSLFTTVFQNIPKKDDKKYNIRKFLNRNL